MSPKYFYLSDHTDCFTCPHLKIEVQYVNTIYLLSSYGELGLDQDSQWGYGDWPGAWQHSDVHCSDFTHNNYMETKIVQSVKYVQIYSLMLFDLMLGFLITGSVCYQTVWTCLLQSRNGNVMVRQQWLRKYWFKISAVELKGASGISFTFHYTHKTTEVQVRE